MHSQQMEYLIFQAPADKSQQGLKCVVKNTFLELVEAFPSEHMSCARVRSCSESRAALMRGSSSFDDDCSVAKGKKHMMIRHADPQLKTFASFSTIPSIDGDGWASESTPSLLSDALEELASPPRTSSPMPSEASLSDHQSDQTEDFSCQPTLKKRNEEDFYVRPKEKTHEVLEKLEWLTNLASEENWTREDLLDHDVTDQLYPYIPVDNEGNITSLGSIQHAESTCKPCSFLKKDRCHKKDLCLYCHFEHEAYNKPVAKHARMSLAKRKRFARKATVEGAK